jgi:hypothetical protein
MKDFLLPIVALVGGIFSLYVDSKDAKKRWLFLAGLIATAIATVAFNVFESHTKEAEKNLAVKIESDRADKLVKILDNLTANVNETKSKVELLLSLGFTPATAKEATSATVSTAVKADRKYDSFVEGKLRFQGLTVEYYPKGMDGETVKKAMEALGFNVKVAPPKNETPTNAIWVGPNVPDEAVRIAGVTLLRAGANIVRVMRIPNPTGARASLIQIGAEPVLAGRPGLSLEKIEAFRQSEIR